jgi:apolipoprotein N-acyltransferase
MPEIKQSPNERPLLPLSDDISIVPYICSELFFNEYPDDIHGTMPIILISNDSWASISYVRHLMYLTVRFRAIQWQRDVLYVSYHYALLCDKKGRIHQLQSS